MNREIKFRAWDKRQKAMVLVNIEHSGAFTLGGYNVLTSPTRPQDLIPLQYINIDDYKGNNIYEGDILRHPEGDVFIAEWRKGYVGFRAFYPGSGDHSAIYHQVSSRGQAVVVGNIYENPELLEDK